MSIERASWGKGFATEALAAVLHYLAGEEKIATIAAWCASDNIGSRRAMEKAGMVKARAEKDALTVGDATFDKLWYEFRGAGAEKDAWPRDASTIAWRIASAEWFCLSGFSTSQ